MEKYLYSAHDGIVYLMGILEHKVPPPILLVFAGLLMWLISRLGVGVAIVVVVRVIGAAVLFLCGAGCAIGGAVTFKRAGTTTDPVNLEKTTVLVTTGIYAISRNPIYVGYVFILLGWAVFLASPVSLVVVLGFTIYLDRFQIRPEERVLAEQFGEGFAAYRSSVRRWL